jgi:hypothetical protein
MSRAYVAIASKWAETIGYSRAVRAGELMFVSGRAVDFSGPAGGNISRSIFVRSLKTIAAAGLSRKSRGEPRFNSTVS